ncbi:unnamed protein product [Closterium sp. NIES-54]
MLPSLLPSLLSSLLPLQSAPCLDRCLLCQRSTGDPRLILGKGYRLVVLGERKSWVRIPVYALRATQCGGSEGIGFESQCMHFGQPSAGGCQRSTGDPRLIIGKGYRLVVLGVMGALTRYLTSPFIPMTAMDAEMASWKSTGTYVDAVPPHRAKKVDGMWIFRVKRPPRSPPAFKARYVARGFSQRQGVDFFHTFSPTPKMTTLQVLLHVAAQRDYELHSLDSSTAFLQGSLHEEIWLRRPPGFTGSFLACTQWSLWRPVYVLRQAPREWLDTLRTTFSALGFTPSTTHDEGTALPVQYVGHGARPWRTGSICPHWTRRCFLG